MCISLLIGGGERRAVVQQVPCQGCTIVAVKLFVGGRVHGRCGSRSSKEKQWECGVYAGGSRQIGALNYLIWIKSPVCLL